MTWRQPQHQNQKPQHEQQSMQGTPSTRANPPGGASGKHNRAFPSMQPAPTAAAPSSQRHGQDGRSTEGRSGQKRQAPHRVQHWSSSCRSRRSPRCRSSGRRGRRSRSWSCIHNEQCTRSCVCICRRGRCRSQRPHPSHKRWLLHCQRCCPASQDHAPLRQGAPWPIAICQPAHRC